MFVLRYTNADVNIVYSLQIERCVYIKNGTDLKYEGYYFVVAVDRKLSWFTKKDIQRSSYSVEMVVSCRLKGISEGSG